jgi:hypothetical protein
LGHLHPEDRFGLLLFNTTTLVLQDFQIWKDVDQSELKTKILQIKANGGTNLSAGNNKVEIPIDLIKTKDSFMLPV